MAPTPLEEFLARVRGAADAAGRVPVETSEFACRRCEDRGWVDGDGGMRRCSCWYADQWRQVAPPAFHDVTLDDLRTVEPVEIHAELADWARLPAGRNVVLIGPVGTGKTHAALAAARARLERGDDVLFLPVTEAIAALRPGGDAGVARRLTHADVLVLDDVGAERSTDWSDAAIFDVVNRRTMDQRSTVITSNLSPSDLADALGARLYSRLVGERAVTLRLAGADRRRQETT